MLQSELTLVPPHCFSKLSSLFSRHDGEVDPAGSVMWCIRVQEGVAVGVHRISDLLQVESAGFG